MPLPDPSQWMAQPPSYILDALKAQGFADAAGNLNPAYRWNPDTMSLDSTSYGGGSYSFAGMPDPNQGAQIVTNLSDYNASGGQSGAVQLAPGENPYFGFGDSAQGYNAGLMPNSGIFASANPAEIAAYKDHARTQALQGVAKVGALVGGTAALAGSGLNAAPAGASASELAPVTLPSSAVPIAPTAAGSGSLASTLGMTAPASGAAVGTGVTNALAGAASKVPDWVGNYLLPGVNSLLGVNASNQASDAMTGAYDRALAENARQYDTTRADLMPWMDAGRDALNQLNNPGQYFTASPDYNFVRGEGERDIGNSFAARGGAASGNALRALTEFNSNLASGEFNNWWNRQAGRAGVGQNTAVNLGNFGQNTAANAGNYLANQGEARASGVLGRNAAVSGGLNDAMYNYLYRRRRP